MAAVSKRDWARRSASASNAEQTTICFSVKPWLSNKCPPVRNRAEGHHYYTHLSRETSYCLSYTEVLSNFLPCGLVPLAVAVRILPSADTTTRPVIVTFPPFLIVNSNV
jgi:hypothetical protein